MRNSKKITESDIKSVKRMPQRRNKLAGKGKGRSSKRKLLYDAAYNATPERKKYRARLNKANRNSPNKKSQDKSHTKSGRLVNESRSRNRSRNRPGRSLK